MSEQVLLHRILQDDELNGALEYDLKVFLGEDIRGLHTGQLTRRQVCVWLRHLPGDSALVRRGVLATEWSRQEHFAASQIDMAKVADYHAIVVAGAKDVPAPALVDRPGWEPDARFDAVAVMTERLVSRA